MSAKPSSRSAARAQRARRRSAGAGRRWSKRVTETSHALELEPSVFRMRSARQIARSLKRSAERSRQRKSTPYRSAMSMLTFYVNRAGKQLSPERKRVLEQAKRELRSAFGKGAPGARSPRPARAASRSAGHARGRRSTRRRP